VERESGHTRNLDDQGKKENSSKIVRKEAVTLSTGMVKVKVEPSGRQDAAGCVGGEKRFGD